MSIEQVLAPTLRPGGVAVMDNLPAHKVAGVQGAIEATGARLRVSKLLRLSWLG